MPSYGEAAAATFEEAAAGWADELEEGHPGKHGGEDDEGDDGGEEILGHDGTSKDGHRPEKREESEAEERNVDRYGTILAHVR